MLMLFVNPAACRQVIYITCKLYTAYFSGAFYYYCPTIASDVGSSYGFKCFYVENYLITKSGNFTLW